MKVRLDFVTNSSSSSFLICKRNLTKEQLAAVRNHSKLGEYLDLDYAEERWRIEENDNYITGCTGMDNYDISELFGIVGINDNAVHWSEFPQELPDKFIEDDMWVEQNKSWQDYLAMIIGGDYED